MVVTNLVIAIVAAVALAHISYGVVKELSIDQKYAITSFLKKNANVIPVQNNGSLLKGTSLEKNLNSSKEEIELSVEDFKILTKNTKAFTLGLADNFELGTFLEKDNLDDENIKNKALKALLTGALQQTNAKRKELLEKIDTIPTITLEDLTSENFSKKIVNVTESEKFNKYLNNTRKDLRKSLVQPIIETCVISGGSWFLANYFKKSASLMNIISSLIALIFGTCRIVPVYKNSDYIQAYTLQLKEQQLHADLVTIQKTYEYVANVEGMKLAESALEVAEVAEEIAEQSLQAIENTLNLIGNIKNDIKENINNKVDSIKNSVNKQVNKATKSAKKIISVPKKISDKLFKKKNN